MGQPLTDGQIAFRIFAGIVVVILVATPIGLWGCPQYNVWEKGLAGEAEFRRAEQNRKILIEEAQAKMESAKHLAAAEIERAKGVAEANKIIADGLGGPEGYLRWLWVSGIKDTKNQVIYVPTEASLPILEAGKR